ncbi:hypothetical protein [Tenacibaculum sp. IB213877]|uniref:hypothetical protein n=1 Tax=Tenacibaculum sp. IB213877 TaxID=3097351 RepID=UPI002A5AC300|nr:hypothetical protein [Tenacibaculum sp. IB213877]MDY0781642.1 hypothetical protein [Tenacibaculum sp. IB213877]
MKKIVLIFFGIVLFSQQISAQIGREGKEKIKAFKIAYLTEKLNLTEREAEKFWPAYNEFSEKRSELFFIERKQIKDKISQAGGIENINEKDAKKILDEIDDVFIDHIKNKQKFKKEVSQFLSAKKILQFEIAEHEFNRKLMKKLKEKRGFRK